MNKYIIYLFLFLLFVSHLSFISADPELNVSDSRGAWTDEGLYTCQIRNLVNSDDLTLAKSDNFIKAPLFGYLFYIPYQIFGISLSVSRLVPLILITLALFFIAKMNAYFKSLVFIMIPCVLLQFHIFHFTHYSMAEVLCVISIFLAVIFLYRAINLNTSKNFNSITAAAFLSITYYLKLQFLYVIFLFPVFIIVLLVLSPLIGIQMDKSFFHLLKKHLVYIFLFGILYLLIWYLPNYELFNHIMIDQTAGRFIEIDKLNVKGIIIDLLYTFYNKTIALKEFRVFFIIFCISFIVGLTFLFSKESNKNFKIIFLLTTTWILIETHKFTMLYLPIRYLISFYFSMGLLIVITVREGYQLFKTGQNTNKLKPGLLLISVAVLMISNIILYEQSISRRTFAIQEVSALFKNYDFKDRPIIGSWAPALTWDTKAISYPIWKDYFNDTEIIKSHNPKAIVFEERDIELLLKEEDMESITDSITEKNIGYWKVNVIWLK